jgi:hypothetical protein
VWIDLQGLERGIREEMERDGIIEEELREGGKIERRIMEMSDSKGWNKYEINYRGMYMIAKRGINRGRIEGGVIE